MEQTSKVGVVEAVLWVLFIALPVDIIAIATKPTFILYVVVGAPLQIFTAFVMFWYFLQKGDRRVFGAQKVARRVVLQALPIPIITTGMFLWLAFRHNHPKAAAAARKRGALKAKMVK